MNSNQLTLTGGARIIRAPLHIRAGRAFSRSLGRWYAAPGATTLSPAGGMQTSSEEAVMCTAYYDSVHVLTFGLGHTAAAGAPDPKDWIHSQASVAQVIQLFKSDAPKYVAGVLRAFTRPLSQAQLDAAFDFNWNTGAIEVAQWVKLWNAGKDAEAEASFAANWEGQPALKARRERERALFFHGTYSGATTAPEFAVNSRQQVIWAQRQTIDLKPYFLGQSAKAA